MSTITNPKYISLIFACLSILAFRLYWLPGYSFSQRNWDDEIGWINEYNSMSPTDYLLYRDAPGYFVFVPRLIIMLGEMNPVMGPFSTLRILIVALQLLCFSAAASCVVNFRTNWKSWLLVFIALSFTYIEDLNYVHNVGYLFIFPIIFFVFRRINQGVPVNKYYVIISIILISKPFTAVIVFLLVLFYYFNKGREKSSLLLLALYSIVYLGAYVLLPHRWATPFNLEFLTLVKVAFDLPWIVLSIIFPAFSIGVIGVLRVLDVPLLRDVMGFMAYSITLISFFRYRPIISRFLRDFSLLSKSLLLVLSVNYVLVFSASDSFWIKYFPLHKLDSPQFLWARWSSVIPLVAVILIMSLVNVSLKARNLLLIFITSQWILLAILGHSWLSRYW